MPFRRWLVFTLCASATLASEPVRAQTHRAWADSTSLSSASAQSTSAVRTSASSPHTRSAATTGTLSWAPAAPTFEAAVGYSSGGYGGNSAAIADVNGDGIPDLVVADWCETNSCANGGVAVLLGNGDGTFQGAVPYSSGGLFADSIAVADLRGNGELDLVVGNCGSNATNVCAGVNGVGVYLGKGDGTFPTLASYVPTMGVSAVAVADVNGDGKPDIIFATDCGSTGSYSGCVGVLLGNGDGTFPTAANQVATYDSGGYGPLALAISDVNGDNKPDVIVTNCGSGALGECGEGTVGVLLGNGDGTFATVVPYDANGVYTDGVAIADVNGDGKPDIVVANSSTSDTVNNGDVAVLLGNGDGTFQAAVAYPSGGYGAASIAVTDINGDEKPDLVVANCSSTTGLCSPGNSGSVGVGVLLGNGDGTFQPVSTYAAGGLTPFGVAVADLNNDNKPDIVVASCYSGNCAASVGSLDVLLNTSPPASGTTLVSSPNPSDFGQVITFTATVASRLGTPTGTVTFYNGTTSLGTSPLNSNDVATLTTSSLPGGSDLITAAYSGDGTFLTSTSSVLTQSVLGISTTTLSVSPSTAAFGGSVTLTAKVISTAGTPANGVTVTFKDAIANGTLGTATLTNGTATFTSTSIPGGTYSVVASYPGDTGTLASVSAAQPLNIQDFTLAATPTSVDISAAGQTGTTTITVAALGGLSAQSISNFSCSGLPAGTTCTFGTVNSSNQSTLTIATTAVAYSRRPALGPHQGLFYAILLPGLMGIVTLGRHTRKLTVLRALGLIAALSLATVWLGCSSSSSSSKTPGTPEGKYPITVSATSGTLKASAVFTLTVQ